MAKSFSELDLELLGYVEPKLVEETSFYKKYSAYAMAGIEKINAKFIYLKSNCRKSDLDKLSEQIMDEKLFLIIPKSLTNVLSFQTIQSLFKKTVELYLQEDLIWGKIQSVFGDYLESIKNSIVTEQYYVPPRQEKGDPRKRLDRIIIDFFKKNIKIKKRLVILCADAGVGKTTLARYVTVELARKAAQDHIIPIYVEATHWNKLRLEDVGELWDIISNSIHAFSSDISITKKLFEHALEQGYLTFIFDGFDELCGHKRSNFRPLEMLNELIAISAKSDARIVTTTRKLYWQAEIESSSNGYIKDNLEILNLAPFNTPQAKDYFDKFFKNDPSKREMALSLYKKLIKANKPPTSGGSRTQFVNLPLCVSMIAVFVNQGGNSLDLAAYGSDFLFKLLFKICEREQKRKNLLTNADNQLKAFQSIAIDYVEEFKPEFDSEDLQIEGINVQDTPILIDHPLLTSDDIGTYRFAYDFLPQYFKAKFMANSFLTDQSDWTVEMISLMSKEANGKGYILEHLQELMDMSKETLRAISNYYHLSRGVLSKPDSQQKSIHESKSFLFHLAKTINSRITQGMTKIDRACALFDALERDNFNSNKIISDLYVIGQIDNLDFYGIKFYNCKFLEAVFTNCSVDNETIFNNCEFMKFLDFQNCSAREWSSVKLVETVFQAPTNLDWQNFVGKILGPKEEYIKDALELALKKFWHHGRLKSFISKDDWPKGSLGHSVYRDDILEAMLKVKLIEYNYLADVKEDVYVFSNESVIDLQHFMDNKQITGKIHAVYDILCKR